MQEDWELSQQFVSDSQGIRAASVLPSNTATSTSTSTSEEANVGDAFSILTGNQAGGLCAFGVPSADLRPVEYQHNHSVTAILTLQGQGKGQGHGQGQEQSSYSYSTGCKDSKIRVFDATTNVLQATLEGHEKPVTSLSTVTTSTGEGYLVSGSWDGTAKVWDVARRAMVATLPDHENSVCVVGLTSATAGQLRMATGSAGLAQNNQISGHTVRLWTVDVTTGQVTCTHQVANDHEGPIRDICVVSPDTLATCSNDGSVRLRSAFTGESTSSLVFLPNQKQSHPPMLLSVTSLDQGSLVAAAAEDGHVVVWSIEDGGGGSEPQILLHPSCVWKVIGLPNGDLLTCGDDGILRVFTRATDRMAPLAERETFAASVQVAHQKKSTGPTPEEVAKLPLWEQNASKRGTSEGQVQLFQKNDTAIAAQWSAASQTWIEVGQVTGSSDGGAIEGVAYDHVLPIEVDQTGGGVAKMQLGYNDGENTFVAAQRFIDTYVLPQHHLQDIADYIQQRVGNETPTLGGGAPAAPVATAGVPMVSYEHLPMQGYKSFELSPKTASTTLEKMKTKIQEFGALSDTQLTTFSSLMNTLAATNRYHASKISSDELQLVQTMLTTLPPAQAFPFLDLVRLAATHPDAAAASNAAFWKTVVAQAVNLVSGNQLEGPAAVAIPMLALRLFANAFRGGSGSQQAVVERLDDLLKVAKQYQASANKNIRLSVATVLYNTAYYLHSQPPQNPPRPERAAHIVSAVDVILRARTYEAEATIRCLVALGTVVLASPEAKEIAKTLFVVSRVEFAASPHGELAKTVAREVYQVLQ